MGLCECTYMCSDIVWVLMRLWKDVSVSEIENETFVDMWFIYLYE